MADMNRMFGRLLALLVLAASGSILTAPPASADWPDTGVFPVLECVRDVDATHFQAVLRAENIESSWLNPVEVPTGYSNWIGSADVVVGAGPGDVGQPTVFPPGPTSFTVELLKSELNAWLLLGSLAWITWEPAVPRCPDDASEVSAPDLVGDVAVGSTVVMAGEQVQAFRSAYAVSYAWRTGCE